MGYGPSMAMEVTLADEQVADRLMNPRDRLHGSESVVVIGDGGKETGEGDPEKLCGVEAWGCSSPEEGSNEAISGRDMASCVR